MEDDLWPSWLPIRQSKFQSTSSVWRTTCSSTVPGGKFRFQSTSSVWRTTYADGYDVRLLTISIHVLRVEDDRRDPGQQNRLRISIHVLRVEDDDRRHGSGREASDFNPRPPCGGRHPDQNILDVLCDFNPRPPCGGRRCAWRWNSLVKGISIHVLRVEDDNIYTLVVQHLNEFQSTSSVWRTTAKTEKNLYFHSYNTAICTDFQPKHSAYAFVCTDRDKQSPEKLVRSIRVRSARFTFARPMPPGEVLRKSARHPDGRRGELRCVQPCFDNGCPAGKSVGCPLPGRSIWPVRP